MTEPLDEMRRYLSSGFGNMFQAASGAARLLSNGGREMRETAAFLLREGRAAEIHNLRVTYEQNRINNSVTESQQRVQASEEESDRKTALDILRAGEIIRREARAAALDEVKQEEVRARIGYSEDENDRKAALDELRSDEVEERRTRNAGLDDLRGNEIRARIERGEEYLNIRREESKNEEKRKKGRHRKSMQSYNDRARWGAAEHNAKMAEIWQRIRNRARNQILSQELAKAGLNTEAGVQATAAAVAAYSTANFGDREAQSAAAFRDRAAEDGVSLDDLITLATEGLEAAGAQFDPEMPEAELAEEFVDQIYADHVADEESLEPADDPTDLGEQIRAANLDAAGIPAAEHDPTISADPENTAVYGLDSAAPQIDSGP